MSITYWNSDLQEMVTAPEEHETKTTCGLDESAGDDETVLSVDFEGHVDAVVVSGVRFVPEITRPVYEAEEVERQCRTISDVYRQAGIEGSEGAKWAQQAADTIRDLRTCLGAFEETKKPKDDANE